LYREKAVKRYKTFLATWRPAGGVNRVVLVDEPTGWMAYFCTDASACELRREWATPGRASERRPSVSVLRTTPPPNAETFPVSRRSISETSD